MGHSLARSCLLLLAGSGTNKRASLLPSMGRGIRAPPPAHLWKRRFQAGVGRLKSTWHTPYLTASKWRHRHHGLPGWNTCQGKSKAFQHHWGHRSELLVAYGTAGITALLLKVWGFSPTCSKLPGLAPLTGASVTRVCLSTGWRRNIGMLTWRP